MNNNIPSEDIDLYIWEGNSDIASRVERCLVNSDIGVLRIDPNMLVLPQKDASRHAVALVSVTVIGDARFIGNDWLMSQDIPVIWVAAEERGHDPRFYPPAYSHTLPLLFTCAELRRLISRLAGAAANSKRQTQVSTPRPLIAVSDVMQKLLADVELYADCNASVLIHGETGVGKERIAELLHERSAVSRGPFVAVNCGAVPEGLFEAHFFGHAKGAFTGAVGAHKGYFEQADGGTLFLDEIGDLPLYQQVKLLRVLEQHSITRLGSTVEVPARFRLVSASHRDLRQQISAQKFRADLYYRLAVIELDIPNLEERGPAEKKAIFQALIGPFVPEKATPVPTWLLDRVGNIYFPGNIRELANLVERIGIIVRQRGAWDKERLEQVFERLNALRLADQSASAPAQREPEPAAELSSAEQAERERVIGALNANGWRRLDTAAELGISRKVLWEKMRKLQITSQGENIAP
ncbi:sigma-54 dependent transcriptional regulator [Pollutimonas bauzanensis]|jgi:DNA-binding NtrC family response regulator|uniref:sigma-54 dependent transcriptional regulator n=1 Tax=Pollutimonas bauzanensis TaxID=658167 RepID=UPI0033420486